MLALALLQSTYTGSSRPCSGIHLNTWLVAQATVEMGALWVQAVLQVLQVVQTQSSKTRHVDQAAVNG